MKQVLKYALFFIVIFIGIGGLLILFSVIDTEDNSLTQIQVPLDTQQAAAEPEISKIELPFGGITLIPNYRFVALYGSPTFKSLGALGEQDLTSSITRIKELASIYQPLSTEKVIPTFEIITTVASAGPTENDDYSQELDPETIKPWIMSAKEQGIYVVLDLQPGRTSFAEQVKQYEALLLEPHVGLALDPEWRLLTPEARHLKKVGSVSIEEVNQTSDWLAELVKTHELPQKIFMVHQFKPSMITARENMKTDRPELAYVIHMDGHGNLGQKIDTWNNIKASLPVNTYLGWKNFIDEDKPAPTLEQTMSQQPTPIFISYQ